MTHVNAQRSEVLSALKPTCCRYLSEFFCPVIYIDFLYFDIALDFPSLFSGSDMSIIHKRANNAGAPSCV